MVGPRESDRSGNFRLVATLSVWFSSPAETKMIVLATAETGGEAE